jgi:hypothetical protein
MALVVGLCACGKGSDSDRAGDSPGHTPQSASPTPSESPRGTSSELRSVSPPGGAYSVAVPAGWQFLDASFPSDHSVWVWRDSAAPERRVEVYGSGCVGCVTDVQTDPDARIPKPVHALPEDVEQSTPVTACVLDYTGKFKGNRTATPIPQGDLPDVGRIVVTFQGEGIDGWFRVDAWLPMFEAAQARAIAQSFQLTSGKQTSC